jgi:hypothetical protein
MSRSVTTTPSSDFFSRPSAWPRSASFQTFGSSSSRLSSSSFSALASKSKIPPQFGLTAGEIGEVVGETVDAFGFHGEFP